MRRNITKWVCFKCNDSNIISNFFYDLGILIGRHYDTDGNLTPYGKQVRTLIKKAEKTKGSEEALKRKYPPCNSEFDAVKGSRVWCTRKR